MSKKQKDTGPVPVPEALPLPVVDNHTHLDHVRGTGVGDLVDDSSVENLIAQAVSVNVTRMVQIGCDLPAARWTVGAVERFPQLLGGVALHPTEATKHAAAGELSQAFEEIEKLAAHPRVRVVGETGLDHYWVDDSAGKAAQEESFRWHIDLAKRLGKALQIHDRDAHDDVIRVLDSEGAPEKTVFHCFSGDAAMARLAADRGWYLSFAGTVTFRNAAGLREALAAVPLEQVMVETDAPYLTPMPYRGRPNASYLVPLTVRAMAGELGRDLSEVCAVLSSTTETVYGPW
ncbi:TatD family hydrolase [Kineosporia sp. J2-2]|uniref:TatD family hydrolase n=1 Tax=Kineosporia corallincola TaxID=2835133 RepID=A0ABS5THJ8_9ACTN|nr:TatD family hydrolase [Kineosporia corallincola]MBT0770571.1 TatD family hydrolase [Kineosporia corallincola]